MNDEEYVWRDERGDYAVVPVNKKDQKTMMSIFVTYTGVLACIAALWGGGALGTQFTFNEVIIVSIIGSIITAIIGILTAGIGGISRCSTYINMRPSFGRMGSWVWSVMASGIPGGIGWFAYETWLFGIMLNSLSPNSWWANIIIASIWGGLLMMTTAIVGYKGLAFLSYLTVPMFIILAGVAFMIAIWNAGGISPLMETLPVDPKPISFGITEAVGLYVVGAVIAADIGRFGRKWWYGSLAWGVQVMILQMFFLVGSGALTISFGGTLITEALLIGGVGIGAYLITIFGQWTTNDSNLYSGALAWSTFIPIKRWKVTAIEGVVGTSIAAGIAYTAGSSLDPFVTFLSLLGIFVPAIGGVLISDFYLYRWYRHEPLLKRYQFKPGMEIGQVNWIGWIGAIFGGVIGGYVIPGIPALNSLIVAIVIYFVGSIICDRLKIKKDIGMFVIPRTGE